MVFDLTGGGFTLDPTANPIAVLAFDSNTIPENPVDFPDGHRQEHACNPRNHRWEPTNNVDDHRRGDRRRERPGRWTGDRHAAFRH